jgi:hypothetical protein
MGERIAIFLGIRQDAEPHLISTGGKTMSAEFADMTNLRTETGAAKSRPGLAIVRRVANSAPPLVLFSVDKTGPTPAEFAQDRAENSGIIKLPAAAAAPAILPQN